MRKIKYRIWEIKENRYYPNFVDLDIDDTGYYDYDLAQTGAVIRTDYLGEGDDEPWRKTQSYNVSDDVIIEQFTGLKDKNGRDIYEGEIVEARWYRAKHARLDTKGEVKFNDGWFYISDDPDGQDRLGVPVHNCYNIEVIGNVHDNKDLLEGIDD